MYELKYLSLYVYWLISHYIYRHNEEVVRMEDAIYLKGFIFLLVTLLIVIAIYLLLIGNRMDKINQAAKSSSLRNDTVAIYLSIYRKHF